MEWIELWAKIQVISMAVAGVVILIAGGIYLYALLRYGRGR